ncbi:MAG: NAD(P)H-hydrate dehydratase [Lentimicrobiaceae bacterium]|jgi:NAD(P)H-hydrate epimerase|nr:NAD(P)H-hydrate dehydratase [Lentimicrobiaceae bacterium]
MKILSSTQIREADRFTIENEPIASIDLMERAASKISEWIYKHANMQNNFVVLAGTGNNGGDGLALARMLHEQGNQVLVYMVRFGESLSEDCRTNYERLKNISEVQLYDVYDESQFPFFREGDIVIDALLGSGLNKPIKGMLKSLIENLNDSGVITIAIDTPSGLYSDAPIDLEKDVVVKADYTLTFQFPKLAFLFPENDSFVGRWEVLSIGLHPQYIYEVRTPYNYTTSSIIKKRVKNRSKFSHKGNYGHALLIAGSEGKFGAAILAAQACLRSGVGLLSVHVSRRAETILQTVVPEAMLSFDCSESYFSSLPKLDAYNAIGVGPGLGTQKETEQALKLLIQETKTPLVLDADALNILSENKTWLAFLPSETILTPHLKEFERLFGKTANSFERLEKQREMSQRYNIIIVLKGAYTCISFPNGQCLFNSTGNPGMATGGSGDVLTGIILGLLAQHYTPKEAATLGVYLHGLAGDLYAESESMESLIASDIISNLGKVFQRIRNY